MGRNKNSSHLSRPTGIPWLSQYGVPEPIVKGMVGVGDGSCDGAITHPQFRLCRSSLMATVVVRLRKR